LSGETGAGAARQYGSTDAAGCGEGGFRVGRMGRHHDAEGKLAITRVELHPKITWSGEKKPTAEELDKIHHAAHENCFIANSVKTEVTVVK
jgi:hypothetical protein